MELALSLGETSKAIKRDSPSSSSSDLVQLDLLPSAPVRRQVTPRSATLSFQIDFGIDYERGSSRASYNDEGNSNGLTRKKLRLTKQQSDFLEECFKEHNSLDPKQKLALADELNLRPRQVEVWFQNRRARTKLKQTEDDCEHLKRCCEKLKEENKRLQKELQELRALKTHQSCLMQPPATTLTLCPSCDRVAATTTTTNFSSKAMVPGS